MAIISLPKKMREPASSFTKLLILIYGPWGVGKSTWASKFKNALFLAPEDGQRFFKCFHQGMTSWRDAKDVYKLLKGPDGKRFNLVVIDTGDMFYDYCEEYVGLKHKFDHPSDLEWGKGWKMVKTEFRKLLSRINALGKGVIIISHAKDQEVKTRTLKITKTMPTLSGSARDVILPMMDVVIYAGFIEIKKKINGKTKRIQKRRAWIWPTETREGKDRTGRLPESLPLTAKAFIKAFKKGRKEEETE